MLELERELQAIKEDGDVRRLLLFHAERERERNLASSSSTQIQTERERERDLQIENWK